jgi:N-acetyl-gamma-glutamyl-phosphate reductase
MKEIVQTAVVGVTGYAGAELARLLLHHPRLKGKPPVFAGRVDAKDAARGGVPLGEIHPELIDSKGSGSLKQEPFSWELLKSAEWSSVSGHAARAVARVGSGCAGARHARD